ncbi:MAG: diacylglycerol kinase family protein [Rhodomicrobium sp.]|jgi:diacylglycerol kinase family enzyme
MRVHAVINRRAGSALGLDADALANEARFAFEKAGHDIAVDLVEPDSMEARLDEAVAAGPDVLIAGGGDGTVRSATSRLLGSKIALGVLPLGTVNRLARDLAMPLEPHAALRALASGAFRTIDVAEVNGEIFLCTSMLGLPSQICEERQNLRGRPFFERSKGYFKLLKIVLAARKKIELSLDGDAAKTRRVRVLSLAVSNNLYRHEPALTFTRKALDGGVLGVYIAKPHSGLGLLWVLARAALGLWTGDDRLDSLAAKRVVIAAKRKRLRLSNDGEVETFKTPLTYQIHPKALTVLAPLA